MTDAAGQRRHADDDDRDVRDDRREMRVSEDERRTNDPTKQTYGAYEEPDEAVRESEPTATDGVSVFSLDGGDELSDAVPKQPPPPGIGPFPVHLVLLVVALVIFVVLLVALA